MYLSVLVFLLYPLNSALNFIVMVVVTVTNSPGCTLNITINASTTQNGNGTNIAQYATDNTMNTDVQKHSSQISTVQGGIVNGAGNQVVMGKQVPRGGGAGRAGRGAPTPPRGGGGGGAGAGAGAGGGVPTPPCGGGGGGDDTPPPPPRGGGRSQSVTPRGRGRGKSATPRGRGRGKSNPPRGGGSITPPSPSVKQETIKTESEFESDWESDSGENQIVIPVDVNRQSVVVDKPVIPVVVVPDPVVPVIQIPGPLPPPRGFFRRIVSVIRPQLSILPMANVVAPGAARAPIAPIAPGAAGAPIALAGPAAPRVWRMPCNITIDLNAETVVIEPNGSPIPSGSGTKKRTAGSTNNSQDIDLVVLEEAEEEEAASETNTPKRRRRTGH